MGGDGGTITSSRQYLRNAGKATHTADWPRHHQQSNQCNHEQEAERTWTTCGLSGEHFDWSCDDIVACPHGKLYLREKALEALLMQRHNNKGRDCQDCPLSHVRGMKDLYSVRVCREITDTGHNDSASNKAATSGSTNEKQTSTHYKIVCPITGVELGKGTTPSFLIATKAKASTPEALELQHPNLLSLQALQEVGISQLQEEYGPFDEKDLIRLAPPKRPRMTKDTIGSTGESDLLNRLGASCQEDIQQRWAEKRMQLKTEEKLHRKKDNKKRKEMYQSGIKKESILSATANLKPSQDGNNNNNNCSKIKNPDGKRIKQQQQRKIDPPSSFLSSSVSNAAQEARVTVQAAVQQNPVLMNLFGKQTTNHEIGKIVGIPLSEKDKRDALFIRR